MKVFPTYVELKGATSERRNEIALEVRANCNQRLYNVDDYYEMIELSREIVEELRNSGHALRHVDEDGESFIVYADPSVYEDKPGLVIGFYLKNDEQPTCVHVDTKKRSA